MFVIALTSGTRIGEPIAARKEWYDPNGFIRLPAQFTKSRKTRVLPVIELIRPALEKHAAGLEEGVYLFDAPRPSNKKLKIAHEASKWFGRFFDRNGINKVFHEVRHTGRKRHELARSKKKSMTLSADMRGPTWTTGMAALPHQSWLLRMKGMRWVFGWRIKNRNQTVAGLRNHRCLDRGSDVAAWLWEYASSIARACRRADPLDVHG